MSNQIKTKNGVLEGIAHESYTVFKGVPYAKPPVGDLRFMPPQEMEPWDGVYKADRFQKIPYQTLPKGDEPITGRFAKEFYSDPDFIPEMSEDCLYLNIWAPNEGEKLPVAFWIHGGGFGGGYSSEVEFDGESYCKKGVILVTVEYRVGVFGFLAHPSLSAENERGISGNYGIMDQIAALRWVYENIDAFGGDPENITVFGQSAGSMSTQVLVSSELTEGMIAKAVLQSGISCKENILATPTLAEEEAYGEKLAAYAVVSDAEELRALSPEALMKAKQQFDAEMYRSLAGLVMVPNVDGYVLKQSVKEVWESGKMRQIPYMLGTVIDDLGAVPEDIEKKQTGALMEECKRWSLKCEEVYKQPSYLYFFNHELPGDDWGAFHTGEVWYMMGTLKRCWRPMEEADYALSEEMVACWTNFMKTGKPDSPATEEWRPHAVNNSFIRDFS